jgi:DNA-binding MarR family transcriptional regulator
MKKSRPEQEAFVAVLRAAERLSMEAAELLKAHGITGVQYNVLRILRGARPEGLNCGQICERMINRDPDMTRLLDRLEARGWVRRDRRADNRRVVVAQVTEEGLEQIAPLDGPLLELHRRQFRRLKKAELARLTELLAMAGAPDETIGA